MLLFAYHHRSDAITRQALSISCPILCNLTLIYWPEFKSKLRNHSERGHSCPQQASPDNRAATRSEIGTWLMLRTGMSALHWPDPNLDLIPFTPFARFPVMA